MLVALTLATVQIDTAYFAGRCVPWMTTEARQETLRSINAVDPRLREMFDAGEREATKLAISHETCSRLMHRQERELERASYAIRNPAR